VLGTLKHESVRGGLVGVVEQLHDDEEMLTALGSAVKGESAARGLRISTL
jgi:hypothetical protein